MMWFAAGLLLFILEIVLRGYYWMSLGMGALVAGVALAYTQRPLWLVIIFAFTAIFVYVVMRRVAARWIVRDEHKHTTHHPGGEHV